MTIEERMELAKDNYKAAVLKAIESLNMEQVYKDTVETIHNGYKQLILDKCGITYDRWRSTIEFNPRSNSPLMTKITETADKMMEELVLAPVELTEKELAAIQRGYETAYKAALKKAVQEKAEEQVHKDFENMEVL
jgi:hypothetical protein